MSTTRKPTCCLISAHRGFFAGIGQPAPSTPRRDRLLRALAEHVDTQSPTPLLRGASTERQALLDAYQWPEQCDLPLPGTQTLQPLIPLVLDVLRLVCGDGDDRRF